MQTYAAVATAAGEAFRIEAVDIDGPRAGEILVEIAGVGLCHTDIVFRDQFIPYPLPAVLGHEGAGIVRAIGDDVEHFEVGDAVILSFGSCGRCPRCADNLPSYCQQFTALNYAGARADGTTAYSGEAGPVASHFFGQSSFAKMAVVAARNAVKVDDTGFDLRIAGTLGCGFQTGAGSILRSFDCPAGSSVTIFGAGPVGLAAVMAAADRQCGHIIAVEPNEERRAKAQGLGATHVVDPMVEDVVLVIKEILPRGSDFVLETSGNEHALAAGKDVLGSYGMLGLVGVPANAEAVLSVNVAEAITFGHRIVGIVEGDSDLQSFIPEMLTMHRQGRFLFDRLVTTYPLSEINKAIEDQIHGRCIKPVLLP